MDRPIDTTAERGRWDGRDKAEGALAVIAQYYDLDLDGYVEDITLYESFARRGDLPSLELGVGTGRVAIALARARLPVWGIDNSEAMLRVAREKAGPAPAERLHLAHADMRNVNLGREFDLVYCALGGFLHLESQEDQIATLVRAREHLAGGGLLVLDLPNAMTIDWESGPHPLVLEWTRSHPQRDTTISKLVSVEVAAAEQTQRLTYWFDEVTVEGTVRRASATVALRHVFPAEARLLLEGAGLRLTSLYGSYDLAPFDDDSARMIVVAAKE